MKKSKKTNKYFDAVKQELEAIQKIIKGNERELDILTEENHDLILKPIFFLIFAKSQPKISQFTTKSIKMFVRWLINVSCIKS